MLLPPASREVFFLTNFPVRETDCTEVRFSRFRSGVNLSVFFLLETLRVLGLGGERIIMQRLAGGKEDAVFLEFDGHVVRYDLQPGSRSSWIPVIWLLWKPPVPWKSRPFRCKKYAFLAGKASSTPSSPAGTYMAPDHGRSRECSRSDCPVYFLSSLNSQNPFARLYREPYSSLPSTNTDFDSFPLNKSTAGICFPNNSKHTPASCFHKLHSLFWLVIFSFSQTTRNPFNCLKTNLCFYPQDIFACNNYSNFTLISGFQKIPSCSLHISHAPGLPDLFLLVIANSSHTLLPTRYPP